MCCRGFRRSPSTGRSSTSSAVRLAARTRSSNGSSRGAGRDRPVRPGRRGLRPQRGDQARGLLVRLRRQPGDRPADHHQRVDRPARPEGTGGRRHRHLRHLRRHPRHGGQPDRRDGRAGLPRLGLEVPRGHPHRVRPRLSDPARQLLRDAHLSALPGDRRRPDDPAGRQTAPDLAVRGHRARGLRPRGLLRAGRVRPVVRLADVPGQAGLLGSGRQVQRAQARLDERDRRLPQRRRHLHRLHHARVPRQVHAVHGRAPGAKVSSGASGAYGAVVRKLRSITAKTVDKEPKWRRTGDKITTGYRPPW